MQIFCRHFTAFEEMCLKYKILPIGMHYEITLHSTDSARSK